MSEKSTQSYTGHTSSQTSSGGEPDDASMKDKAAESAHAGAQAAGEVAQSTAGHAKEVAGEAQSQARNLVGEARDQLRSQAGDQHRNAVSNLRSLGDELRSMAGGSQQNGVATDLVSRVADRSLGAADWLDGRQPADLLEELRDFARRRPGAFLAGALVAGAVAGRLTRGAVAAHTDDGSSDRPTPGPGQPRSGGETSVPQSPTAGTYDAAPNGAESFSASDGPDRGRHAEMDAGSVRDGGGAPPPVSGQGGWSS